MSELRLSNMSISPKRPYSDMRLSAPNSPAQSTRVSMLCDELEREIVKETNEREKLLDMRQQSLLDKEMLLDLRLQEVASREKVLKIKEDEMQRNLDKEIQKARLKQNRLDVELELLEKDRRSVTTSKIEYDELKKSLLKKELEVTKRQEEIRATDIEQVRKSSDMLYQTRELNKKIEEVEKLGKVNALEKTRVGARELEISRREDELMELEIHLSREREELRKKMAELEERESAVSASKRRLYESKSKLSEKKIDMKLKMTECCRNIERSHNAVLFAQKVQEVMEEEWMTDRMKCWKIDNLIDDILE